MYTYLPHYIGSNHWKLEKICPKGSFEVYMMEKGPLALIVSIIQHISYTTYGINNFFYVPNVYHVLASISYWLQVLSKIGPILSHFLPLYSIWSSLCILSTLLPHQTSTHYSFLNTKITISIHKLNSL